MISKTSKKLLEDLHVKSKDNQRYSERDMEFIMDNYLRLSDRQIARELGRSTKAVKSKREDMGISKYNNPDINPNNERTVFREDYLIDDEIEALLNFIKTTNYKYFKSVAIERLKFLSNKK